MKFIIKVDIRKRCEEKLDAFRLYCKVCHTLLCEYLLFPTNIVKQLSSIFDGLLDNDDTRTYQIYSSYLEKP